MRLNDLQKQLYNNKIDKGYNVVDIDREFCMLYSKVTSAYKSYRKGKDNLGSDFADVAICLLGLSEMLDKSLENEILKAISKKKKKDD